MSKETDFPVPASMAARLGSDLLLTLGIATATALLVMVPTLMTEAAPERVGTPTLTLLRDGKIGDRLAEFRPAGDEEFFAERPLTPAALAMPMSLVWPEPGDWTPPRTVAQAKPPAATGAVVQPPRRVAVLSEKKGQAVAPPLVILPPAAMIAMEPIHVAETAGSDANDSSLRQYVVAPAMKVVDVVSGAAGSVQAAGSWTLTQANGLLPRW